MIHLFTVDFPEALQLSIKEECEAKGKLINKAEAKGKYGCLTADPLKYWVISGGTVQSSEKLNPLMSVYEEVLRTSQRILNEEIEIPSDDEYIESRISINYQKGIGGFYQSHIDSQYYTALLFGNTISTDGGGESIFRLSEGTREQIKIRPIAGLVALFNGMLLPHGSEPITRGENMPYDAVPYRITIPMQMHPISGITRQAGADDFLGLGTK
jgi:hypothetical protein